MNAEIYNAYVAILHDELVPAMGCTEPIAIAYAAALARDTLGVTPERIEIQASGNLIKNVKSVVVPNTNGLKGIEAAAAAGVIAGDAGRALEVISRVSPDQKERIRDMASRNMCSVSLLESGRVLDLIITLRAGDLWARVRIADRHTNVVLVEKNGSVLLEKPVSDSAEDSLTDKSVLRVADILEFAETVDLDLVSPLLEQQIQCNTAIAQEGLRTSWGANIGSVLLADYPNDIKTEAKAWAAAGSDARMSGCEMPVVILSGSGNQGITASVPVVRYAQHLGVSREKLYRALLVSDLVTVHQKSGIGRLSAYCGAVSAGVGAGAGIAYLLEGTYEAIAHTIVNAVAIISGTICDGAKPSCAAKIAAAVDAGVLGYHMFRSGQQFRGGEGIVTKGVEETIANIGRLGRFGMRETDREIIRIMTDCRS